MLTVRCLLDYMLNRNEYVELIDVRTNQRLVCGVGGRVQFSEYQNEMVCYFYTDVRNMDTVLYIAIAPTAKVCDE